MKKIDFKFHPKNTARRNFSSSSVMKRKMNKDFAASGEPPVIDKQFATKVCMWCLFEGDQYFIFCPNCTSCQYCGLHMDASGTLNRCGRCGNHAPEGEPDKKAKQRFIAL